MSVAAVTRPTQKAQQADWARLIPGDVLGLQKNSNARSTKVSLLKGSLQSTAHDASIPRNNVTFLLPGPLNSRAGWKWLRSMVTDWAMVFLNWLIVGVLLIPLHALFPGVRSFGYAAGSPVSLLGTAVLHAALITLIGYAEGLHLASSDFRKQGRILGKSVIWATSLLCAAYTLQGAPWMISGLLCVAGLLHFTALWGWRWRGGEYERPDTAEIRNVLIVGAGGAGRRVAGSIEAHPNSGRRVCGFLDDERPLGKGVIGRVADLARIARTEFVDEIILAAPRNTSFTRRVLSEAQSLRLDVEIVPELFGCSAVGQEIERVGDIPVVCLHAEHLPALGLLLKRFADTVVASAALLALFPLLAAIGLLIRLDSEGPIFYCAQRAGRKGTLFRCFKFRTMVKNADVLKLDLRCNNQRAGPFFKISSDPRITRVGRYLRRYSLDELPQLWNVVRGEMSLVGPRPHPLDDIAGYKIEDFARLDVTPGITGLWQVTARRDPSFHRGVELDREYIRKWSLGLDARILFKTLLAVVQGSGE